MAVCWHCPAQPMALVTLGIFSTLQWLKPSCYPLRKGFVSLVLLAVGPHGHQLWCREGTATRALLLVAGLVSAMTAVVAIMISLLQRALQWTMRAAFLAKIKKGGIVGNCSGSVESLTENMRVEISLEILRFTLEKDGSKGVSGERRDVPVRKKGIEE